MSSTPRAQRSPKKAQATPKTKSPAKSPAKSRKSRGKQKANEGENGDEEQRDSADGTMVDVDLEVNGDAENAQGKEGEKKGKEVRRREKGWDWVSLLDPKSPDHPAVFTKDARFFFLPSGNSINIHSASSGEVVSTLTPPSTTKASKQRITSLCLNPSNPFQLLSSHMDGAVRVWDFLDGVLLRTVELEHPVTHLSVSEGLKDWVVVALTEPGKKKDKSDAPPKPQTVLYRLSLTTQTKHLIGKLPPASHLAVSNSGKHVVATSGTNAHVFSLPPTGSDGKATLLAKCHSPDRFTCLVFHPEEEWFATGDEIGVIRYWYCSSASPGEKGQQLQSATHTWHAHPVRSLAFTPNGAYLLSGGEEAVVVVWQLHSGQKEFLPRIGGPIRWLSVRRATGQPGGEEEEWLAGLEDRTLVWLSAGSLKVARSVARVKLDISYSASLSPEESKQSQSAPLPLALHPTTSSLVLPSSHPSFLQVYDHPTRTLISELEVSPTNKISKRNPDAPNPPVARVTHASISPSGEWLATVDVRHAGEDLTELELEGGRTSTRLKVWRWSAEEKQWELSTRIERPHGVEEVTSLSWMPTPPLPTGPTLLGELLATTGLDGQTKLWRAKLTKESDETGTEESISWVLRSQLSYRGLLPRASEFSPDGSVLAVGQGRCITLWDPVGCLLKGVLAGPGGVGAEVEEVGFVGREGRWLAALERRGGGGGKRGRGERAVVLWDLLSCSVSWEYELGNVEAKVVPLSGEARLTVFVSSQNSQEKEGKKSKAGGTKALVFGTASSRPERIHKLPFSLRNVIPYPASSSSTSSGKTPPGSSQQREGQSSFVGITTALDIVLFGDSLLPSDKPVPQTQKLDPTAPALRTLWHDYFGLPSPSTSQPALGSQTGTGRPKVQLDPLVGEGEEKLFDGPAYMLPALGTLYEPFMSSILRPRPADTPSTSTSIPTNGQEPAAQQGTEVRKPERRQEKPGRVVDEKEFEMFVELFREMARSPSSSMTSATSTTASTSTSSAAIAATPARSQAPGTPTTNGNGKPLENGTGKAKRGKVNGADPQDTPATPRSTRRTPAKAQQVDEGAMDVDTPSALSAPVAAVQDVVEETPTGKGGNPRKRGRKST